MSYIYEAVVETNTRGEIVHEYRNIAEMAKRLKIPQKLCYALVASRATYQGSKFRRKTAAEQGLRPKFVTELLTEVLADYRARPEGEFIPETFVRNLRGQKLG